MTNSTLTSHRRRVQKLEAIRARKAQHVVLVFSGTSEADAKRMNKELRSLEIGVSSTA